MTQRREPIRSKAIRRAAKGEACTLVLPFICNHDPQTVVFCHLSDESFGKGVKADDTSGFFGCSACHSAYDLRRTDLEPADLLAQVLRAYQRTIRRLVELDVLSLKRDPPRPFSERPTKPRKPKAERKAIPQPAEHHWPSRSIPKRQKERT